MEKIAKQTSAHRALMTKLGDPVAELTDWNPMSGGGSSFQMLELVEVSLDRIEFRRTAAMIRFYRIFMGSGLVLFGLAVLAATQS